MARESLTALREQIRRIERPAAALHGVVSSGVPAIDRVLPGGGLARGAVHEILGMAGDEEDGALAAVFTATILGRLAAAAEGDGVVLWCLPRPDLHGPGLAAYGLDPARLILVRARRDDEILWAMEEGLRAQGLAAVVGEIGSLAAVASRRLQLAAERSGITAFLLRRWRHAAEAERERNLPNAAATRWRISALPSRPRPIPSQVFVIRHPHEITGSSPGRDPGAIGASFATLGPRFRGGDGYRASSSRRTGSGIGHPRWRIELLRCRGGAPAAWEVEVADAAGSLSLAAAMADRPATPIGNAQSEKFRSTG